MIPSHFDDVTAEEVKSLIDDGVREGRSLEYKASLPGRADADKREFLADVTSFANAGGGDLLWGVEERRDENGQPTGIPDRVIGLPGTNIDAEIRRLDAVIRDGVEPRIPGIRFKAIDDAMPAPVLLLRVPCSWVSPHMVTFKNTSRFYSRNSAGKHQLDVTELRSAFLASEGQAVKVARLRDVRIGRLVAGETPIRLSGQKTAIMHVFPFAALNAAFSIDVAEIAREHPYLPPLGSTGFSFRFNFDGLLSHTGSGRPDDSPSYLQLFRNGVIETVNAALCVSDKPDLIPSQAYESDLIEALENVIRFYESVGIGLPCFVLIALVGVKGCRLAVSRSRHWGDDEAAIDRDILILPDAVVQRFEDDVGALLRPAFDAVWQAAGFAASGNFDGTGRWVGRG